jgi:Spy/CpxP family protein refolding chaperone
MNSRRARLLTRLVAPLSVSLSAPLLAPLFTTALSIPAAAAVAQSAAERPHAAAAMWPALQLSESQQARVREIHARYAPAVAATRQMARDSAQRINDRELADLRNILTSEQQQTFDYYMSGKKRARRGTVPRLMPAKIGISRPPLP